MVLSQSGRQWEQGGALPILSRKCFVCQGSQKKFADMIEQLDFTAGTNVSLHVDGKNHGVQPDFDSVCPYRSWHSNTQPDCE